MVSILRGWLIPRRVHLDRMGDRDATIAALEETVREQKKQLAILAGSYREPPV